MISIRRPSEEIIRAFVRQQSRLAYTYSAVGATASTPPPGYQLDHARFSLGRGEQAFANAKEALRGWKQFDVGWGYAFPGDTPLETNQTVAVVFRVLGLWTVSSARIVYVVDEPDRFGFAYGTLPGHVESGEERFLVERDAEGNVWYDVRAFSRPQHILAMLGYPYARRLQKRFVRESAAAMQREAACPPRTAPVA